MNILKNILTKIYKNILKNILKNIELKEILYVYRTITHI